MTAGRFLGSVRARVAVLLALAAFPLLITAAGLSYEAYRQDLNRAVRPDMRTWSLHSDGHAVGTGEDRPGDLPPAGRLPSIVADAGAASTMLSRSGEPFAYEVRRLRDGQLLLVGNPADGGAAARSDLMRHAAVIGLTLLIGMAIAYAGTNRTMVLPLRRLTDAVEHWRDTGVFESGPIEEMPDELATFSRAFAQAAGALAEHERELAEAGSRQELLMQEIHHRVKNNLQIVASLLNLQASRIRVPAAKAEFQAARDRVRALATLHRHLYTEGKLRTINMRIFLLELCGQLFQAMGEREGDRIQLLVDAVPLEMASDQAVPLSLIVTEAVSNSVKYAFPGGRRGHVAVRFSVEGDTAHLVIEDDGVGTSTEKGDSETGPRDGLGIQLIRGFARQLKAELRVTDGNGTRYEVDIPTQPGTHDGAATQETAGSAALRQAG